jgi:hypothetical protein
LTKLSFVKSHERYTEPSGTIPPLADSADADPDPNPINPSTTITTVMKRVEVIIPPAYATSVPN